MPKSTLQNLLKNWIEAGEHFEQGLISESVFLRAQFRAADVASSIQPSNTKDAATQLMFAVLLWKEETVTPTTPCQIAMDKMLGHVVDFLEEIGRA
jgi:hypothetical protein